MRSKYNGKTAKRGYKGKNRNYKQLQSNIYNWEKYAKIKDSNGNHPLGQEILQSHADYVGGVPTMTVHSISTSNKPPIQVSDLDYADAIFAPEPE